MFGVGAVVPVWSMWLWWLMGSSGIRLTFSTMAFSPLTVLCWSASLVMCCDTPLITLLNSKPFSTETLLSKSVGPWLVVWLGCSSLVGDASS